ncbi:hypothetical protein GCM10027569_51580 [Flindersiella endophytica]
MADVVVEVEQSSGDAVLVGPEAFESAIDRFLGHRRATGDFLHGRPLAVPLPGTTLTAGLAFPQAFPATCTKPANPLRSRFCNAAARSGG